MGNIIRSEVDFNYTEESLVEADKELEARVNLQKEIIENVNNLSQEIFSNLPNDDLKGKFNLLKEYHNDLSHELFWLGMINQYRNSGRRLDLDLYKIFFKSN